MASADADIPAQNHQNSASTPETSLHPNASAPASSDATSSSAITPTQIREDLVATAVKFLRNPQVQGRPLEQRRAFLKRKGMTDVEVELAMSRSGTSAMEDSSSPVADRAPPFATGPPALYPVSAPVPSSWTRLRDAANVIVLLTGAAYAVYHLYKRFIVPALYGDESVKSDPLLEVRRSVDELRRSMSDIVSSINETQTLMRSQQRQIDDVIRTSGLLRGPDEIERLHIGEVKDELKSLKALLLNRKQFPALPTTTPVIPAWQLQQGNSAEKSLEDNVVSRAEMKSSTTAVENSENQTDTNLLETVAEETNQQSGSSVKDHTQSEIIQNGISEHHDAADAGHVAAADAELVSNGPRPNTNDDDNDDAGCNAAAAE